MVWLPVRREILALQEKMVPVRSVRGQAVPPGTTVQVQTTGTEAVTEHVPVPVVEFSESRSDKLSEFYGTDSFAGVGWFGKGQRLSPHIHSNTHAFKIIGTGYSNARRKRRLPLHDLRLKIPLMMPVRKNSLEKTG